MTTVRFAPTQLALVHLESALIKPLGRSDDVPKGLGIRHRYACTGAVRTPPYTFPTALEGSVLARHLRDGCGATPAACAGEILRVSFDDDARK